MLNRHIVGLKWILLGHSNRWTQCTHHEPSCGVRSSWERRETPSVSPLPLSPLWSKPRMMEFLIIMPRLSRQRLCLWFHFDFMVHVYLFRITMIVILKYCICATFCASQLDKNKTNIMIVPSKYKQCQENVLTVCLDFQNIFPLQCSGKNNKYIMYVLFYEPTC